jgi:hypothetical protein
VLHSRRSEERDAPLHARHCITTAGPPRLAMVRALSLVGLLFICGVASAQSRTTIFGATLGQKLPEPQPCDNYRARGEMSAPNRKALRSMDECWMVKDLRVNYKVSADRVEQISVSWDDNRRPIDCHTAEQALISKFGRYTSKNRRDTPRTELTWHLPDATATFQNPAEEGQRSCVFAVRSITMAAQ